MDNKTASQLLRAVRYANRPIKQDVNDHIDSVRNWQRLKRIDQRSREHMAHSKLAEVNGNGYKLTDIVCGCLHPIKHYRVIVCRNGTEISGQLCPITVGLRRVRLDLRNGVLSDPQVIDNLLRRAAIEQDGISSGRCTTAEDAKRNGK